MNTNVNLFILNIIFVYCFTSCESPKKHVENRSLSQIPILFYIPTFCLDENVFSVIFSENGHQAIIRRDSASNIICYYAKVDANNCLYLKPLEIRDLVVRIEFEPKTKNIISFVSTNGGCFFNYNCDNISIDIVGLNGQSMSINFEKHLYEELIKCHQHYGKSSKYGNMTEILFFSYNLSEVLGLNQINSCEFIVENLRTICNLQNYDIISADSIVDQKVFKRLLSQSFCIKDLDGFRDELYNTLHK